MIEIRPAVDSDANAIATLWHQGWKDGHHGLVPEDLYKHRTLESFRPRALERVPNCLVAIDADTGQLLGFVSLKGEELDQFFLHADARGTGLAKRLMQAGEDRLRDNGIQRAFLAVVEGNDRAIGFYRKAGWQEVGLIHYKAQIESGSFDMPCLRFEKDLT
ncbi:GNAT family N-acetyltransferase [Aestuariispira insulae]|uniref:L-amino acid N-acyltransferase YncA n=1 Tax=Aestuariispira insulae TaxID=1461337 RepID=A0A3D9HMP9_9PROT|nr:GNAT family N-acetyltransferase [Aestuariispira insulae]RED50764.1 L-amino acid N-acyltransferase YncA [Aestuariispira insulae]